MCALIFAVTGCGNNTPTQTKVSDSPPSAAESNAGAVSEGAIELAKANDVTIYANKPAEDAVFREITIQTKNRAKTFPWITSENRTYYPKAYEADINKDSQTELVLILTIDHGTGVLAQEVHVLNVEDLSEVPVENPVEAAYKQVPSKITAASDSVTVELEINKQKVEKKFKKSDAAIWFDRVGYGAFTEYTYQDSKLLANVSVNVSPAETAGTLVVEYDSNLKVLNISMKE